MWNDDNDIVAAARKVISKLKAIATIKFGEYWNITTASPQKANILTSLSRTFWYTHENRTITLDYIDSLIDEAFNILNDIQIELRQGINKQSYIYLVADVKCSLLQAQTGIVNLKGVYYNDDHFKKSIDARIRHIRDRYEQFQTQFNSYDIPYYEPNE